MDESSPIRIAAVIVAGGAGSRMGGLLPKQFMRLAGKTVLAHAYDTFDAHPAIETIVVVVPEGTIEKTRAEIDAERIAVAGRTRRDSVRSGLNALGQTDITHVLIHDAARPLIPRRVIDRVIAMLHEADAVIPGLPIVDTLAHGTEHLGDIVPRGGLVRVQTPQGFKLDVLRNAHRAWPENVDATDDAQMVRHLGVAVRLVQGNPMLEKITHPEDLIAAESRIAMDVRTAIGLDVHRLETGEDLWLCGILIPHAKGLSGHSDADVALHALTDALLGTIASGDIGTHFPPTDPQWKGANSARFLDHAAKLISERGGIIDFVDLTLMCEEPKIGPYRQSMVGRIAELLRIPPEHVSVKATTTERLGFTGRGEGIAAQAVATVRLPRSSS